ncbi:MAG: 2-dehydro-3-deoxyglucarate aldolase [Hydrogenophaga sp.]|uniref:HpcH/HpaI aldolase family protein n=1 Tax=Hydrogenophaga sp. TaxID=1904254 RepID=UPI00257C06FB|nr:aldolase/citrate lyase family protein [Hydrogenophaga sp.]MBL0945150.1 2-dehydro-3-deoxyglucarate aldolase [Hydrogenophaga sp.]
MAPFLSRIREPGACLFGTWVKLDSLETLEMLAWAGHDFVVIDMEHSPHTLESTYRSIVAAQGFGMSALVRLPDLHSHTAQRVLDAGADGVLVPRVRDAADARHAIDMLSFGPRGSRGMGVTSRAGRWGALPTADYLAHGDQHVARVLQFEDQAALDAVDNILDVPGVNSAFVGYGDLSLSSGKPPGHADNAARIQRWLAVCRERQIPCGTAVADAAAAARSREQGFAFVMVGNDAAMFGRAAVQSLQGLKG